MVEDQKKFILSHFACRGCGGKGEHSRLTEKEARRKSGVADSSCNAAVPFALQRGPRHQTEWEQCTLCNGTGLLRINQLNCEPLPNMPISGRMKKLREANKRINIGDASLRFPIKAINNNEDSPLIIVAGCGIAGSALTLGLLQRGLRVICFERDEYFAQRSQGYGLTMQQGGAVLRSLGIEINGVSSSAHHSWTHDGKLLGSYGFQYHKEAQERVQHNIQIPRQQLRERLVEQIPSGIVRWGVRVTGYSAASDDGNPNHRVCAHLSDGTSLNCTVLVGCDGIRSTIRMQKLESKEKNSTPLQYLGVMVILGYAAIDDLRLRGQLNQTSDGTTRFYSMPFSGRHGNEEARSDETEEDLTMWQLSFPFLESDSINLANEGSEALLAEAMKRCGSWHGLVPDLLAATKAHNVTGYPVYDRELPDLNELRRGQGNDHDAFVTLLGDAAHPMSPFKGQGANQALIDALMCARTIADSLIGLQLQDDVFRDIIPSSFGPSQMDIQNSLERFEESMLARVRPKVRDSHNNVHLLHSPAVLNEGNAPRAGVAAASMGPESYS